MAVLGLAPPNVTWVILKPLPVALLRILLSLVLWSLHELLPDKLCGPNCGPKPEADSSAEPDVYGVVLVACSVVTAEVCGVLSVVVVAVITW